MNRHWRITVSQAHSSQQGLLLVVHSFQFPVWTAEFTLASGKKPSADNLTPSYLWMGNYHSASGWPVWKRKALNTASFVTQTKFAVLLPSAHIIEAEWPAPATLVGTAPPSTLCSSPQTSTTPLFLYGLSLASILCNLLISLLPPRRWGSFFVHWHSPVPRRVAGAQHTLSKYLSSGWVNEDAFWRTGLQGVTLVRVWRPN